MPTYTQVGTADYGTVTAGSWSPALCHRGSFDNAAETLKFWLNDVLDDSRSASLGSAQNWVHKRNITTTYTDPSTITDATKAGWTTLEETEPSSSNFVNPNVAGGTFCDYIYTALQPPAAAAAGTWDEWSYRLKFQYTGGSPTVTWYKLTGA
jgi:hypothetical protein